MKTLLRSALFWVAFTLCLIIAMQYAIKENTSIAIVDDYGKLVGSISDTDSEFVIWYGLYIQRMMNYFEILTLYCLPLFAVISTILVLNRSYGDGYFEIEKAYGVGTKTYYLSRLLAITTINIIVWLVCEFAAFHLYCLSRGILVECFNLHDYLIDSTIRILRLFFCGVFPGCLFYVGVTYITGVLLKSGYAGCVFGCGHVLLIYASRHNGHIRMSSVFDYITPFPTKLFQYWTFYDTKWFYEKTIRNPWSDGEMLLHLGIIVGAAIFCFAISYISTNKRTV